MSRPTHVWRNTGTLESVDQYLNVKLKDISVVDPDANPHMVRVGVRVCARAVLRVLQRFRLSRAAHAQNSVKNCFIRGSVVRYVQVPKGEVSVGGGGGAGAASRAPKRALCRF